MLSLAENFEAISAAVQSCRSDAWSSGTVNSGVEALQFFYHDHQVPSRPQSLVLSKEATSEELERLSDACDKATFGRAHEDVLDESFRKAGKMDCQRFASKFDLDSSGILQQVLPVLLKKNSNNPVKAELYKMNIYGPGGFFKPHKDTPRSDKMFGSLVVVFPTSHVGGQLVLRHNGRTFTLDSGTEPSNIAYIAFFSDVEHEVLPITSGYRVTLTYNLYYGSRPTRMIIPTTVDTTSDIGSLKNIISSLINRPEFMPQGGLLGFALSYAYPISINSTYFSTLLAQLKGSDGIIRDACLALGLSVSMHGVVKEDEDEDEPRYLMFDKAMDFEKFGEVSNGLAESFASHGKRKRMILAHDLTKCKTPEDVVVSSWSGTTIRSRPILWVSKLENWGGYQTQYMTYGNEASINYEYVNLCLVASFGKEQSE